VAGRPRGTGTVPESVVLYVEDNPANVRLVSQLFARRPQVKLLTAYTASSGLELALARGA
jgi:CheY-like chemotaxis protein